MPAGVVGDGVVQALQAEGARRAVRPERPAAGRAGRPGPSTQVTTATGSCAADRLGDLAELGERLPGDRLDEDVEDPAAGQPDGEGVVVADAVPLAGSARRSRRRPWPPRRPRPRRSRRRRCRPPCRRGRRASTRPAGRGAERQVATTVPIPTVSPACHQPIRSRPATSRTSGDHSRQLLERGHAVPGDEVVDRAAAPPHPAGQRLVAVAALVRVHPDHARAPAAAAGPSARRAGRCRRAPSRRCTATTTAPRAVPRWPQRSRNALSTSPSRVPPDQSGIAEPLAASAWSGSRSRSSRVTRVSRVPMVNTSVQAGRARTAACANRSSASA